MLDLGKRRSIDLLIEHFWKKGYTTVSRKYGTYLSEPSQIGGFDVDVIARYKKNYAIGITLSEQDLYEPKTLKKLIYLATRKTRYTNKNVELFVGISVQYIKNARSMIEILDAEIRKNIILIPIIEKSLSTGRFKQNSKKLLFS